MRYYVLYQRTRIEVPHNPRKGVCDVCGRSILKKEIKVTQLHHFYYKFKIETVKSNPILSLENTVEVCFRCHKIADWLRDATTYVQNFDEIIKVAKTMPLFLQDRFIEICKLWLMEKKKNE